MLEDRSFGSTWRSRVILRQRERPQSGPVSAALFNANRIAEGVELTLCRSSLELILAVENGAPIDSLVSFLSDTVSPTQLEILSSLMDQKKIESLWP